MILCAAITFKFMDTNDEERTTTICGYRHHNCFHIWGNYIKPSYCKKLISIVQGFMNDKGEFLDRSAAREHFINCNQGVPKHPLELFSEDLY